MGMKEGSNEKGMFPANFTKPLWAILSRKYIYYHPKTAQFAASSLLLWYFFTHLKYLTRKIW